MTLQSQNTLALLEKYRDSFHSVLPAEYRAYHVLQISLDHEAVKGAGDLTVNKQLSAYIDTLVEMSGCRFAAGGYLETRNLYSVSDHFGEGESARNIHLGIDIWLPAGTEIQAPAAGRVHSFRINSAYRDYGPTIILEHSFEDGTFHTLYGHLSASSLDNIRQGDTIAAGTVIARVGDSGENGSWPPHLHFQVIGDTGGWSGDYPGVSSLAELGYYSVNCPDPNTVLNLPFL